MTSVGDDIFLSAPSGSIGKKRQFSYIDVLNTYVAFPHSSSILEHIPTFKASFRPLFIGRANFGTFSAWILSF